MAVMESTGAATAGIEDGRGRAPLWRPSREWRERTEMTRFMRLASERAGRALADYDELWRWSVSEPEQFWAAIWDHCGVRASHPYEQVLDSHTMPGARWFRGAQLNYAENLLMRERDSDAIALLHASELRELGSLTWGQLTGQVAALAAGLRALGVARGDRVAAYMPNIPETLIAFLATASIGAIWSSAAPEFGARSVIDRFAQIEPTALFAVDGYRHNGRDFDRSEQVQAIAAELPTLRHTVLLPYLSPDATAEGLPGGISWDDLIDEQAGPHADLPGSAHVQTRQSAHAPTAALKKHAPAGTSSASNKHAPAAIQFEQVPFDHPLWVLYSSGTTGLPKAIVHGHGGILLEQLKKSLLHLDLRAGDRMFWFTTTGWMMWNFLVGCLLSDAAIVLYDGSPGHPDMDALWRLAERTGMSCMGVSAGYLAACEEAGVKPWREHDLSALRAIGSTGSPLSPESFRWVYEQADRDLWLFSTSGGTDVCTAFVGGCPLLPVYEGELQCRALGCAVESWDVHGDPLIDQVGELVITEPLPSMPLFFWGEDPPTRDGHGGERYRESYFEMYPGVWRHGDWIRITPRGGAIIYGRSDSTINRQGVRMGTSEIYRAASLVGEVLDALVVDVPREQDAGAHPGAEGGGAGPDSPASAGAELWMILFVVLAPGVALDEELSARIKQRIRTDCSPRHVPDEIVQIAQVPRTLSGKVLEVPVKRILMGVPPAQAASAGSLADPHSLDFFVELARARGGGAPH
jgi:acetoacetyl-CoA synthetase